MRGESIHHRTSAAFLAIWIGAWIGGLVAGHGHTIAGLTIATVGTLAAFHVHAGTEQIVVDWITANPEQQLDLLEEGDP
jgi:hypothetical protein